MELEEARSFLKGIYEDDIKLLKGVNEVGKTIEVEKLVKAIETVLQALENSIPKEKVLEKMNKLRDTTEVEDFSCSTYRYTINVLEELLGEYKGYDIVTVFREKTEQVPVNINKIKEFMKDI